MKRFLICLCLVAFLGGCATVKEIKLTSKLENPEYCAPDAKSYIVETCNKLKINPKKLAEAFVRINTTGLKFAPDGTIRGVHGALDNMERLLKETPRPTYFEFGVMFVENQKYMNSYTGMGVMTVGKLVLDMIGINKPIEDCDAMQFLELIAMERAELPTVSASLRTFLSSGLLSQQKVRTGEKVMLVKNGGFVSITGEVYPSYALNF